MYCPTNEEIREEAIQNSPVEGVQSGGKMDVLMSVVDEFHRLQFKYFPLFCFEARRVNAVMLKELAEVGHKTPTRMVGGKVYEGSTGWSKDKSFKHKWIIPQQLLVFMRHIYHDFWSDDNAKTRDKFMKGVLKGEDAYTLLDKVYKKYGQNIIRTVTKEDRQAIGIQ